MKLNEYLTKPTKPLTKNKRIISFVNETKETALNAKISELESEATRLQEMEDKYTKMLAQTEVLRDHISNSTIHEDELLYKIKLLEADLERGELVKQEKNELEESFKSLKGEHSTQSNTLDLAQKTNLDLSEKAQKFTQQIAGLLAENTQLSQISDTSQQQAIDNNNELADIKEQLTKISKVFSSTQVKYKQETEKNSVLSRDLSHWQRVANTLQAEKNDLEKTRKMLQSWFESVESDYQNSTEIGRVNKSEIQKLRKAVLTMNEQIAELLDENSYLSEKNTFLLSELAAPKHASIGAIARLEGFKLPSNMSFKGKNFLGNGVPTLLKRDRGGQDDQ